MSLTGWMSGRAEASTTQVTERGREEAQLPQIVVALGALLSAYQHPLQPCHELPLPASAHPAMPSSANSCLPTPSPASLARVGCYTLPARLSLKPSGLCNIAIKSTECLCSNPSLDTYTLCDLGQAASPLSASDPSPRKVHFWPQSF